MKELAHPHYLKTRDGEKIFFNTNFKVSDYNPKDIPIVFNYGLVCSFQHFSRQVPFLHEQGYKVIIHHYRGHYNSSGANDFSKINFETFTQDIEDLLDFIGAPKCIMVGHSMGVNTTLEFTRRYPERIFAQILISGTVFPPHDVMFDTNIMDITLPVIKKLTSHYPGVWKKIWENSGFNPLVPYFVRKGGFNESKVSLEYVQEYLIKMGQLPPTFFFHLVETMKKHDVIADLGKMNLPTLIMGGDQDSVIPNRLQKILSDKIPGSELYFIKDGSHVPSIDFPDLVNERIHAFLQKSFREASQGPYKSAEV